MKPIRILIYTALALGAMIFWCYTHSDRAKISRLLESAAEIATRDPSESVMEGAVKARSLAAFFGKTCRFSIPEAHLAETISNESLSGAILAFRHDATALKVKFSDLDIDVDAPNAHVEGMVDLSGTDGRLKIDARESRAFTAELRKNDDGEWKIVAVSVPKGRTP